MITGPGRSGTSAVTGALSQLGIHVPPPLVDWNRSNKKGFFETRWVVDFQKQVLSQSHTYEFDADPLSITRLERVAAESTQQELTDWLREAAAGHRQMVIKDPRSVWLHRYWTQAAQDCGLTLSYLTMMRHPTEVVGSRTAYYGKFKDERQARDYAISKVAGWINVSLLNERQTRQQPRVYLRYTDLLADWRTALTTVADKLSLQYNADLRTGDPNPVDEFITPSLHRIKTNWEELDVPPELREIAEAVWQACERLADHGFDDDLGARFDELTNRYDRLYRDAAAITSDTTTSAVARAQEQAIRKTKKKLQDKINSAKEAVSAAEQAAAAEPADHPAPLRTSLHTAARIGRRVVKRVRRRIRR
jgi:hypothetical protein